MCGGDLIKDKKSFLLDCDPRVKILIAFGFSLIVALTYSFETLTLAFFYTIILLYLSRISIKILIKRLLLINLFLYVVVFTLPFTTQGEEVFRLGCLGISKPGLLMALFIFLKSNLIIMASICLLSTSSIFTLAHALHHLCVPSKLVQVLFFTFRYIHVIQREFRSLWNATSLRGFVPRTDLFTYRTMAYLVGNLLIKSYDRSQRVYEAMLCRGFTGTFPVYQHFKLRPRDFYFALFGSLYLIFMAVLAYHHP